MAAPRCAIRKPVVSTPALPIGENRFSGLRVSLVAKKTPPTKGLEEYQGASGNHFLQGMMRIRKKG